MHINVQKLFKKLLIFAKAIIIKNIEKDLYCNYMKGVCKRLIQHQEVKKIIFFQLR